jgi:hypothetical protein
MRLRFYEEAAVVCCLDAMTGDRDLTSDQLARTRMLSWEEMNSKELSLLRRNGLWGEEKLVGERAVVVRTDGVQRRGNIVSIFTDTMRSKQRVRRPIPRGGRGTIQSPKRILLRKWILDSLARYF